LWNDRIRIVESVEPQWKAFEVSYRGRILRALETIDEDPISGAPLFEPLRGLWSFRDGDLRILYRIISEARAVMILDLSRTMEPRG